MSETPKPQTRLDIALATMYATLVDCGEYSANAHADAVAELAALRAERDQLRRAMAAWIRNDRAHCQERDELRIERDRLREALEDVIDMAVCDNCGGHVSEHDVDAKYTKCIRFNKSIAAARAALEATNHA